MKSRGRTLTRVLVVISSLVILAACKKVKADTAQGAPPEAKVVPFPDAMLFSVDRPDQFPLATAAERAAAPTDSPHG